GLITSIITTLAGLVVPLLTKNLVDGFSVSSLTVPLIIPIAAAFIIQSVVHGVSTYLLTSFHHKTIAILWVNISVRLIRLSVISLDNTASGETVSRVVNDTNIVRDLITDHFPQFVTGIISILGAVTILLIMDWKMTLIMMLAVPITVAVMIP